jgi:YD repeat-containing protein
MRPLFSILLAFMLSCNGLDDRQEPVHGERAVKIKLSKRISRYKPDQAYTGSISSRYLDHFFLKDKLLSDRLPQEKIRKHRIKEITYGESYVEEFDRMGQRIYQKWPTWGEQLRLAYQYDGMGKPLKAFLIEGSDTLGQCGFKYDAWGKLVQAGPLLFTYYPDGKVKRIEDQSEVEEYKYDANGHLTEARFGLQPGVLACGSRVFAWRGEYNNKGQLVKSETSSLCPTIETYSYSKHGLLLERITQYKLNKDTYATTYKYQDGLLAEIATSSSDKPLYIERFSYKLY